MTNIYIKDNKLCIEKSLDEKIVGLVVRGGQWITGEWGFAYEIDRSYKGKEPETSDIFYDCSDMDLEDFIKLCNKLKLNLYELQLSPNN